MTDGRRLVLGTMTFGSQVGRVEAATMLDVCRDAGITMVDTANVYSGGASETVLGEVLRGRREKLTLATKVGMPSVDAGDAAPLSGRAVHACVKASLRRLRIDHVDLLYLHQPDRATPIEETLIAVDELVRSGVVRQVGVSNYAAWQVAELLAVARREGLTTPTVSQPVYNLIARRIEAEYVEFAAHAGLANIVYNPLAGGLLTGKHRFEQVPDAGRFGNIGVSHMYRERYWNRRLFDAVQALGQVAAREGLTLVELAFRWLLSREAVTAVLLGASSVEHLRTNIAACQGPPPSEEALLDCDAVWEDLSGAAPAYNR